MLNAQSAKVYFSEFAINTCELKTVVGNSFGNLKINGNLMLKSKVPSHSGSVALRQLNPIYKRCHKVFKKRKKITHEIKPTRRMNLKNESELGDICISFIHRSISFYRQHLKITFKLCTPVCMEVRGVFHGTLLPLILKTSLNTNHVKSLTEL